MTAAVRIVNVTADELAQLIRDEVHAAIGAHDREWIGVDEVAAMLGVKRSTVPTLCARDGLPHAKVARAYRFKRADVLAWLEDRASKPRGHSRQHGATLALLKRKG
jgi:excisionase family DNA binding protein